MGQAISSLRITDVDSSVIEIKNITSECNENWIGSVPQVTVLYTESHLLYYAKTLSCDDSNRFAHLLDWRDCSAAAGARDAVARPHTTM